MSASSHEILKTVFGYEQFRGKQEHIIQHILQGENALILMPTGGGKSLCYQIPSLIRPGVGIVISPLISLMQDQVNALVQRGIRAAFLNSSLSLKESYRVLEQMYQGQFDLLYVAPERLTTAHFLEFLASTQIALFAIDEAHCISQWGHHFRPEYRQLSILPEQFSTVPRIALTATANQATRQDIIAHLGLENAKVFVAGFNRPNIHYQVTAKNNTDQQLLKLLSSKHRHETGIIYCLSRKRTETVANWLQRQGYPALPYHAGLPSKMRKNHQAQFFERDDLCIVATIAFGMGIDKPNVRFVAHLDLPKSLEAYYQETGRAGRDGLPAEAWMVYGLEDTFKLQRLIGTTVTDEKQLRLEKQKLDMMLGYCELTTCRRQVLLGYFGETLSEPCGNCDNCLNPTPMWDGTEVAQKALSCVYRTGQRFGVNYLIDVLLGNTNERIRTFGHQRVSTFGIGRGLEKSAWQSVFRQLLALGFITVDADYGGLQLTESSRPLLRGEQKLALRRELNKRNVFVKKRVRQEVTNFSKTDKQLWEALRAKRLEIAQTQKVPEFAVFHDSVLKDMVYYRPKSLEELGKLKGIGKNKVSHYGQQFLDIILEHDL
jgi:ATP-dependent DNA helicase RecQ